MTSTPPTGSPFYITTAISYPNAAPHIGHAYEAITSDAIARFRKAQGYDVRFQTGTDEHGLKMAKAAREQGRPVAEYAREMTLQFKAMCDILDISYDRFIRTTDTDNHVAATALWTAMADKGDLYLGRYEGWYSVRDEAFYDEAELVTADSGEKLSPQGTAVEWTAEETWFFRLSNYQQKLLDLYEIKPEFVRPAGRLNEVKRFVEGGLNDLSMSRTSFDWGVPVPGSDGHVMYVWVDALTNYLTGLGYPDDSDMVARYWPHCVHNIGKDIVRFHAVYWPAFLMSAGIDLPKEIFGHGFILHRGEKMSKSTGNVIDPMTLVERYGSDAIRYFLLREVGFGNDGSASEEAIVARCNADLANNLGNLAQRSLSMIAKNCDGAIPAAASPDEADAALLATIERCQREAVERMEGFAINQALEAIWEAASAANQYFADQAPWALRKTDAARADSVLYTTAEAVRRLAIMARWAIPRSADALLDQLAVAADDRNFAALARPLVAGTQLPTPSGVFPRLQLVEA